MDELAQYRQSRREQHLTPQPLWREVLGARLRRLRKRRGLTLTELGARAGVSPQYLSEVERGRKEASSEMIAAISGALGLTLIDLTSHVADELQRSASSTHVDQLLQPDSNSWAQLALVA
ncbi:helix-turn-helix domain-containing protein [Nesterenkonia haasae]|uniref:helix-turn-helix domain-containing protein n=1 Tax=Nesterenkonia haasae TaxID=2587813 RepID=UPI001391B862|nr:helix-turn-helix transcriptional regulator [Nesterenkonia haasae]NDK30951.1 helix-turn-helix transcriptional regulator [Nesterenkonia haasae]